MSGRLTSSNITSEGSPRQLPQRLLTVSRLLNAVPRALEDGGERMAQGAVVIDDQDTFGRGAR